MTEYDGKNLQIWKLHSWRMNWYYIFKLRAVQLGCVFHYAASLTTVTASLSKDSPKTTICNISFTWISSKTARTATGSTADISAANTKQCSISKSRSRIWKLYDSAPLNCTSQATINFSTIKNKHIVSQKQKWKNSTLLKHVIWTCSKIMRKVAH